VLHCVLLPPIWNSVVGENRRIREGNSLLIKSLPVTGDTATPTGLPSELAGGACSSTVVKLTCPTTYRGIYEQSLQCCWEMRSTESAGAGAGTLRSFSTSEPGQLLALTRIQSTTRKRRYRKGQVITCCFFEIMLAKEPSPLCRHDKDETSGNP